MQLDHKQIQQIETIIQAFKRSEGKSINDKEALTFALEFTADLLAISQAPKRVLN